MLRSKVEFLVVTAARAASGGDMDLPANEHAEEIETHAAFDLSMIPTETLTSCAGGVLCEYRKVAVKPAVWAVEYVSSTLAPTKPAIRGWVCR
jgi:hypothetical protein